MEKKKIIIKDKQKKLKRFSVIFFYSIVILLVLLFVFVLGLSIKKYYITNNTIIETQKNAIILENPLKNIILSNQNPDGTIDKQKVFNQALSEFDERYIIYMTLVLGANKLYKSKIGFGSPSVEIKIGEETWSIELSEDGLNLKKQSIEDKDIIIYTSKEEIVNALLSKDIKESIKQSFQSGNTKIELVAGKTELLSKGYLGMYKGLAG